ncbi:hypothetical protein F5890DRAFT_1470776 [Lentinula detonsa]|uniref:Uncharacterized protein n=1 Tax=Lentinula detonsa TaxID=2804962 RepID=A0AA38Q8Q7_9AGAR|nr:hypothetical protein F5890DRAFT_1470776 [Lentinula detonsa]
MSIAHTAAFFAPNDLSELTSSWGEQKFEIVQGPGIAPFVITVDEMVAAIQTSLALGRRWKIAVAPRYPEITQALNRIIPDVYNAHLSYIAEGQLHRSRVIITYDCFFTPTQLTTLQEAKKISNSLNRDTTVSFPKPVRRPRGKSETTGSMTGVIIENFTKSDMDQSILVAGLMAHARETQRKNLWRLRRDTKQPKSTRGTERYSISESETQSTTMGLNAKISKWRLDSTKSIERSTADDTDMDTMSNVGNHVITTEQNDGPSREGPSII